MPPVTPQLERHRIYHSRNMEEADGFLASKNFRVRFPGRDATPLDLHINGVYLPGVYIGYFCYGRAVELRALPARTDYWFQLSTQRRFAIDIGRRRLVCDEHQAAVL